MKISKVIRRKGPGGSSVNAVVAANVGESDSETTASTRQHVQIVQRDGKTEVTEHATDERPPSA